MRGEMVSDNASSYGEIRSQSALRKMYARVRGQVRSWGSRLKDRLFVAGVISIVALIILLVGILLYLVFAVLWRLAFGIW